MGNPEKSYDVVIIGGGPAGLSAGVYTARDRLSTLLLEKGMVGGQIVNTELVENYPGFPDGVSGFDLTQSMHQQAVKFGLETVSTEVTGLEIAGKEKLVKTSGGDFTARAVIIAGGSERQKLGVPGEAEFTGKGVSYCATCDGAFFRDRPVAVVGGGDAAVTEAIHLTKFASRVVLIHRRRELRASHILRERAQAEPRLEFLWDSVVEEVLGETFVSGLRVSNVATGEKSALDIAGVFVSIGFKPNTAYLKGKLALDEDGAVVTDEMMATNVPGVFAAGDIRSQSIRQVIAAAGDGAIAAVAAARYLRG